MATQPLSPDIHFRLMPRRKKIAKGLFIVTVRSNPSIQAGRYARIVRGWQERFRSRLLAPESKRLRITGAEGFRIRYEGYIKRERLPSCVGGVRRAALWDGRQCGRECS